MSTKTEDLDRFEHRHAIAQVMNDIHIGPFDPDLPEFVNEVDPLIVVIHTTRQIEETIGVLREGVRQMAALCGWDGDLTTLTPQALSDVDQEMEAAFARHGWQLQPAPPC